MRGMEHENSNHRVQRKCNSQNMFVLQTTCPIRKARGFPVWGFCKSYDRTYLIILVTLFRTGFAKGMDQSLLLYTMAYIFHLSIICYNNSITVELLLSNKPTATLRGKTFNKYSNNDLRDHRPGWGPPSPRCEDNSCQPHQPERGAQDASALSHDTSWHPHLEYNQTTSMPVNRKCAKIEAGLFTMTCITQILDWWCHRPFFFIIAISLKFQVITTKIKISLRSGTFVHIKCDKLSTLIVMTDHCQTMLHNHGKLQ